ncbi:MULTISPECIES: TetR/AcrR family transcriptional regulator [Psychrilyobacter]|uniref:TetR family transcriptional regulator n=1 Tax=Psychrilyobacter piezotolerans TaxID=2293438 RepID=A0ABX9KII7_9FUSO|nr:MULTISPECIES: TetR/AcrR family transcriptional regulator [Psychrilyobacter]MCS5422850.1 TetR/AcrR family transcriptional regulator [Psychrilyobacter sp. S5]NDI77389.1 TetR/AcrR family transcriptional regulator [Psychrilyobacter piezotolerans]RDE63693.1 TetR/AcrR family transcriptional regulator [Psychrilyobacter sp. S5]REI42037.1 TetR family transcriptional regulator [Psychrilyobacter piezotolerans]
MGKQDTIEKILKCAMSLFSQKGYTLTTTKEIAKEAGVSEMTVFRHFESKKNLFEKVFNEYVFLPNIKFIFENNLEWDLEKDLLKISHIYQDILSKNKKIILMELKNKELTSELSSPLFKFPIEFKKLLIEYFYKMKEKDNIKYDPEIIAINFLSSNFGIFISFLMVDNLTDDIDMEVSISSFVSVFTKGITS